MFEVGDEIFCVRGASSRDFKVFITTGKVYKVIKPCGIWQLVCVTGDNGVEENYLSLRFIPNTPEAKAEFMRRKLEEVG